MITKVMVMDAWYFLFKENAPVRQYPRGAVGKKGTPFYSPYPGNLKNNGIHMRGNEIVLDEEKVGYIGYANIRSKRPMFIEKTEEQFIQKMIGLGGKLTIG